MSKYLLYTCCAGLLLFTSTSQAEDLLEPGSHTVRADITYDSNAGSEGAWGTEVGVGGALFPLDDFGVFYGYSDNDDRKLQTLGLYLEEHYTSYAPIIPFIGMGAGWQWLDVNDTDETDNALMVRGQTGIKVLVSENIAISGQFIFTWANEELYFRSDGTRGETNPFFSLGVRFYY